MKLPADPKEALERILTPRYFRTLDCGVLTFQKNGREEQRRFVVSSGLGFDAAVCHNMAVSKAKRVLHALHPVSYTHLRVMKPLLLQGFFDVEQSIFFQTSTGKLTYF